MDWVMRGEGHEGVEAEGGEEEGGEDEGGEDEGGEDEGGEDEGGEDEGGEGPIEGVEEGGGIGGDGSELPPIACEGDEADRCRVKDGD